MAEPSRYFSFRTGAFADAAAGDRPRSPRKESLLAAMLVWRRHTNVLERVAAESLSRELGVSAETVEAYRSTLRKLFETRGLQPFDEDRPYKDSAIGLREQISSDLADLLALAGGRRSPQLDALNGDIASGWEDFLQLLRASSRGSWAQRLASAIESARGAQIGGVARSAAFTRLYGRERELAELVLALQERPVIVLHGPPGIGKTALAAELTRPSRDEHVWVRLADVKSEAGVAAAVAESLELIQAPSTESNSRTDDVVAAIDLRFGEQARLLIVFDGCEDDGAVAGYRTLIGDLRDRCRNGDALRFVVTTRDGSRPDPDLEWGFEVGPLPASEGNGDPSFELFCEIGMGAGKRVPTATETKQIRQLCEAHGRCPLPIKLAAAAYAQGTPFAKLIAAARRGAADPRSAVQRGFDALPPATQGLLAQLFVFDGSFDLATAAYVVESSLDEVTRLTRPLIGSYLVPAKPVDGIDRYELASRARPVVRRRAEALTRDHSDRLLDHLLRHIRYRAGTRRTVWHRHVQPELATAVGFVRGAVKRESKQGEPIDKVVDLILELVPLWVAGGWFSYGCDILEQADERLERSDTAPAALRVRTKCSIGTMRWYMHDVRRARKAFKAALELATEAGDLDAVAEANVGIGLTNDRIAPFQAAAEHFDLFKIRPEAARIAASAHVGIGWRRYHESNYRLAWEHFTIAEEIASAAGEESEAFAALVGLGWVLRRRCDFSAAAKIYGRASVLAEAFEDTNLQMTVLNAKAELAHADARYEEARRLIEQATELSERNGARSVWSRLVGSNGELTRATADGVVDLLDARSLLKESLLAAERNDIESERAWRHFGLGVVEFLLEVPSRARDHFERSEAIASRYASESTHEDGWQVARCHHRLARLDLLEATTDAQRLVAVMRLLEAARTQDRLGVLDDLSWTLQDLAHAACLLGSPDVAARLTGARFHLDELIGRGPVRILRSAHRDWYAEMLGRACDQAHRDLGADWDAQLEAGRREAAAGLHRSLGAVLSYVGEWAAARGGRAPQR